MLPDDFLRLLEGALPTLEDGFRELPAYRAELQSAAAMHEVLAEVAARLADNYPYFHPLYAGQMLKPPHPVAHAAYALAMCLNPNNHARDGGRASSEMELEAVEEIAAMCGWQPGGFLGHLTSGGTFANLEALWVAGCLAPGGRILASAQAHYTHGRISAVLGLPFAEVPAGREGGMDPGALERELRRGGVSTVGATLGTTGLGAVDPLEDILALRSRYGFRLHVDAAYGGYFRLIGSELEPAAGRAFAALPAADSIVIDPHKHGLQPYGCGCVLFRDPAVGRFYRHQSPYTYFTSKQLHLGEISLECSRAGASAVALWATQRLLPLRPDGEFARRLAASRRAALALHGRLAASERFLAPLPPALDIVVWTLRAASPAGASQLASRCFAAAAEQDLHLALIELPQAMFAPGSWPAQTEEAGGSVTALRSVLMKPEHEAWIEQIHARIEQAAVTAATI
jgi:glutamate/tyrosine decarboxylase-like PLP-dependent enzyme